MSASTEKKNRRAAREAGTDKKAMAAQAEEKKKAQSKLRWTIGTVAVAVFIVLVLLVNSSLLYTGTTALTIGGVKYSPAQVNYYYSNQYYSFASQYGSYASIFGLDTSAGITGLDYQTCPMLEDGTWKDYFLQAAQAELTQTQALCSYAAQNGISLTQEEIDEVDANFDGLDEYAQSLGFSGVKAFFAANYGRGVTKAIVRQAMLDSQLANKAYDHMADSLDYSAQELEDYYQGLDGSSDLFDYAYYYVAAETVEVTGENGETSSEATEETIADAKATAENILTAYNILLKGTEEEAVDYADLLDQAVSATVEGANASYYAGYEGSSLSSAYADFMKAERQPGDATVAENPNGDGFYVAVYISRDDNHYATAQVRHILLRAEADEDGTYSDEAKAEALARAEDVLAQWEAGEKTEESFAALANELSEDGGSNTNGGLYEDIYKGQMVPEFDQFCFEGHKPGDTGIVYGENGGYAGYHVIYYVGEGELYSEYIARKALSSESMSSWMQEITSGVEAKTGFGLRLVG